MDSPKERSRNDYETGIQQVFWLITAISIGQSKYEHDMQATTVPILHNL